MREGIGSKLFKICGGSKHSSAEYVGKVITGIETMPDQIKIDFQDGTKIRIYDAAQSCCERRYMTFDDGPADLLTKRWKHAMIKGTKDASDDDEYNVHEIEFLEIMTEDGSHITIANHNEHNGYYGGFGLCIEEIKD